MLSIQSRHSFEVNRNYHIVRPFNFDLEKLMSRCSLNIASVIYVEIYDFWHCIVLAHFEGETSASSLEMT